MPLPRPFRLPIKVALVVLTLGLAALPTLADPLRILGIGPEAKKITREALTAMGIREVKDSREVNVNGEAKRREIRYGGVSLPALLQKQGIETLDRDNLRAATILVIAKDGYRTSFSWGELFNAPAGESVIVITEENGVPNPAREGDFSLRAFSDLRPGPRHVRDVVEIRIELPR